MAAIGQGLSQQTAGKAGLVKKLCAIMAEVGYIQKTGWNDKHKYHYVTESDLVDAIRDKLAKSGIFIFPSVISVDRKLLYKTQSGGEMYITDAMIRWTFVDGDTGETHACEMPGCGTDMQDKGIYKAITGSEKYMLMKAFLVSTGDDPEREGDSNGNGHTQAAPLTPYGLQQAPTPAAQPIQQAKVAPQAGKPPTNGNPVRIITDAQRKRFFAKYKGSGWSDEQVKEKLASLGIGSGHAIPVSEYEALCKWADNAGVPDSSEEYDGTDADVDVLI